MAVRDLVLAQIIERRAYGYELVDRLRDLIRALGLSNASIYTSLTSLAKDGLIVEVGTDPGDFGGRYQVRKFYEATSKGRQHHREWKSETAKKAAFREELHFQMLLAQEGDIPALLEGLDRVEEGCEEQLAAIAVFSEWGLKLGVLSDFGLPLVEDGLTMHLQSTIEWVGRSRQALQNRLGENSSVRPGRKRP